MATGLGGAVVGVGNAVKIGVYVAGSPTSGDGDGVGVRDGVGGSVGWLIVSTGVAEGVLVDSRDPSVSALEPGDVTPTGKSARLIGASVSLVAAPCRLKAWP
jgi:hypothetical protein